MIASRTICAFFVVLSSWAFGARADAPQINWQHVHPYPSGAWLSSAAWGSPGYVVVGWDRELLFSPDGLAWERIVLTNAQNEFWATDKVCYDSGKYVVAGQGTVLWSTDGRNWNLSDAPTNLWYRAAAAGNGTYVVAADGQLFVSTNAQNWERRVAQPSLVDLAFGNGLWVGVARSLGVYASYDLRTWTNVYPRVISVPPIVHQNLIIIREVPILNTVCFGNGQFVVGGAGCYDDEINGIMCSTTMLTSSNGLAWHRPSLAGLDAFGEVHDTAFAKGQFLALQRDSLLVSTNGEFWQRAADLSPPGTLKSVAASPSGLSIAVGGLGSIFASEDGRAWDSVSASRGEYVVSLTHAAGRFLAVANGAWYGSILTSTDGYDWRHSLTNFDKGLSAAAYGGGVWVVVGSDGSIFSSPDGSSWVDRSLPGSYIDLETIAYGNGRFVAATWGGRTYQSTNGIDWLQTDTPFVGQFRDLRFLNGKFTAVGERGSVLFSDDGVSWRGTNAPTTEELFCVTYGKGRYVAGGFFTFAHSLDGRTWSVQPTSFQVSDIEFMDGWFIAVCGGYGVLASRDGVSWEKVSDAGNGSDFQELAADNGVLVLGGSLSLYRGASSESENFKERLRFLFPGQLEFYGTRGYDYRLEQSTDLFDWSPASNWTAGANDYLIWNTNIRTDGGTFWRAVERVR